MFKLIASDMDGTLLDENGQVPPGVRTISWTAPRRIQASCGTPSG